MEAPKSICIVALSPILRDARVLRQVEYLAPYFNVTVIGYGESHPGWKDSANIRFIPVNHSAGRRGVSQLVQRVLRRGGRYYRALYDRWYWSEPDFADAFWAATSSRFDAYHANDWETLPLAAEAAKRNRARLVFDAHEYGPSVHEENPRWLANYVPLITYFLRRYAGNVAASITVAPLIADRLRDEFGLTPVVILNAPELVDLPPRRPDPEHVRLISHGVAMENRHLETMIETVRLTDERFSLHFMLIEHTPGYIERLRHLGDQVAPGRVFFHDPVPPAQIVSTICHHDMGFFLLEPVSYNYRVALPNKFFDFVAAGLAVCVGPSPSMAAMIDQYGFGCVAPSFKPTDVAQTLNALSSEQIAAMQAAAVRTREQINARVEMAKLVRLYQELLP